MSAPVFSVRFVSGPKLRENEKYWPWDQDCGGTITLGADAIHLAGKLKTNVAVNILTLGPAQQLLKRAVARDMTEVIPVQDLLRVVVRQRPGKKTAGFRFYQRRDDGTIAVHPVVTGLMAKDPDPAVVIAALSAVIPASIITDEAGAPVLAPAPPPNWYADPSGRHQLRYWDGRAWTADVADNGQQSVDPQPV